jgi:hypothetical protein
MAPPRGQHRHNRQESRDYLKFDVPAEVKMKTVRILVERYQPFGKNCGLLRQGLLYPEDGGVRFLRNFGIFINVVTSQKTVIFTGLLLQNVSLWLG